MDKLLDMDKLDKFIFDSDKQLELDTWIDLDTLSKKENRVNRESEQRCFIARYCRPCVR